MTERNITTQPMELLEWKMSSRILIGLLLSIASALMLAVAMPPGGLWPLAVLGFIPFILAQYRILPERWSSLASAIAIGGLIGLYIMPAFLTLPGAPWYMELLPVIFGLFVFAADRRTRSFHEATGYRWFVLNGAFGWVGIEMIRSMIPVLGTWGFLAYAFYREPLLIQPASIFGVFGMSLITLFAGYTLGLWVLGWFDRRWRFDQEDSMVDPQHAQRWMLWVGAACAVWVVSGLLMLKPVSQEGVRTAALQPGFRRLWSEEEKASGWLEYERYMELYSELYELLVSQTEDAAQEGVDLIVWPEGALNFDPQVDHTDELKELAARTGAYLVLPYGVDYRNEVTILSPAGDFLGVYGKNHPVVFVHEESQTRGTYPVYDTDLGTIGTIICYDMDFTDTARRIANKGAGIIAVPSGDWPGIADKHFAHLVFRAVENRAVMIKSDRNYDSAVIDSYGRILSLTYSENPEQKTVTAVVSAAALDGIASGKTIQGMLGDWVGWLSLAGLAAFAIVTPVVLRRRAVGQK